MTWMLAVAVFPAASVATADTVTGEALPERSRVICHVPSEAIAANWPFTFTETSVSSSATVPLTRTWTGSEVPELSAGEVIATRGATSSIVRVTCEEPLIVTMFAKMLPTSVELAKLTDADGA